LIARLRRAGVELLEAFAEVVDEPGVRATVAGRVERLVVELKQALRVGQRPLLLDAAGDRDEEDLRLHLGGRRAIGIVLPEDGALGFEGVADDKPVERPQTGALQARVETAGSGI